MPTKIGNSTITSIYTGVIEILKVYLGDILMFEKETNAMIENLFNINGSITDIIKTNYTPPDNQLVNGALRVFGCSEDHYEQGQWINFEANTVYVVTVDSYVKNGCTNDLIISIYDNVNEQIIATDTFSNTENLKLEFNTGSYTTCLVGFQKDGASDTTSYLELHGITVYKK